jgi:outer membrane protein TolC
MMRLSAVLGALVLPALFLAGCQQHRFMTEADFNYYRAQALKPPDQCPQDDELGPLVQVPYVSTPVNPEGKRREISLAECVALALENGRTGDFFDRVGSTRSSLLGAVTAARSNPTNATDSLRVFAYDPAISATEIEMALSKFDARWQTAMVWNRVDEPRSLQSAFARTSSTLNREQAQFISQLLKPLPTGGLAGITFRTDYDYSNLNQNLGIENPSYTPAAEITLEQPLLQGNGVFINQILDRIPGGIRNQIPIGGRVPGILLARIGTDQVQLEFENRVHNMLFAVEQAYWNLYCAYWDLYSRETAMRQAHEAWQVAKIRFDTGKISGQDFAQIAQQFHLFRAQRLQSLGKGAQRIGVLEAERNLRYLIGLPLEDGYRLTPSDAPTVAPYVPDWNLALQDGLRRRPELIQIRLDIQANQLAVLREKNFSLPDLRAFGRYEVNALGDHLDGQDNGSALRNLMSGDFTSWEFGMRLEIPIGFREANAAVRQVQLGLAQRMAFLRDTEEKLSFSMGRAYRDIFETHELIRIQRARRQEAATQLKLQHQEFVLGRANIDVLLEAQRNWADALRDEHFAICDYNVALVDFERQKGTILDRCNVSILEGPVPACAQARASAHIRERARSIMLQEPLNDVPGVEALCTPEGETLVVPDVMSVRPGASVPALLEQQKALPPIPELPGRTTKPAPVTTQKFKDRPVPPIVPAGIRTTSELPKPATVKAPEAPPEPKLVPVKDMPAPAGRAFEPPQGGPSKASVVIPPAEEVRDQRPVSEVPIAIPPPVAEPSPPPAAPADQPKDTGVKASVVFPAEKPATRSGTERARVTITPDTEPAPGKAKVSVRFEEPAKGPAKATVVIPAERPDPLLPPP